MTTPLGLRLKFHPRETCSLIDPRSGDEGDIIFRHLQGVGDDIVVVYTLIYKENLAIGLGHNLLGNRQKYLGYHEKDVETVAISYASDPSYRYVYMSAHSKEGKWYPLSSCEIEDNCLVVYVALNSHANYPHEVTKCRYCGLANDHCSSKGKIVKLQATRVLVNDFYRKEIPSPPYKKN